MSRTLATLVAALLALAGVVTVTNHPAAADQHTVRIVLETTDQGYGCTAGCDAVDLSDGDWQPQLVLPLGAEVELVFVWAHEAYPNEEHVIVLDGYGLETDQIDAHNREATLHFIADQPGSHVLKCDLHCDLHDYMQRATVRVQPSGDGLTSTPTYTPTSLTLHSNVGVISGFEPVDLDVTLTADDGAPITRAELRFFVETEFGGVSDHVHIGTVRTDEHGTATYRFTPLTASSEQRVVARFAGMGVYDASEHEIELRVTGTPAARYSPQASSFERVAGPFTARTAAIVILTIWAMFAFVLIETLRIARPKDLDAPGAGHPTDEHETPDEPATAATEPQRSQP
jgi:hypothetical protein